MMSKEKIQEMKSVEDEKSDGLTAQQWHRVRALFEAAMERGPEEREEFLRVECGEDQEVIGEVLELLTTDERAEEFLEEPLIVGGALLDDDEQMEDVTGRRIGPYQLLRELGRGGMAVVYLAVRADEQYEKQVAIKLVWPGLQSGEVERRFRQERQILAKLDHPNIARLIDGGATAEGWPYLVMEYVAGMPINEYCDERRLSISERLKLFRTVCAAVQYAHQNLVIHRDLKPGNILVTAEGVVKLLDFGIAKILQPDSRTEAVTLTRTGLHLMTPEFASPEQVRGQVAITTASDVYSLGVVLYELLSGHRPFPAGERPLHELVRVICEEDAPPPSAAIDRVVMETEMNGSERPAHTPGSVSETREGKPEKLRARLKGDLDNIALMALRKEASERYSSVEQLSEDIGRHLDGEPVKARKPTWPYRASKFARRHQAGVMASVLLLMALIAGLSVTMWQLRQARRALYPRDIKQAAQDWAEGDLARMRKTLDKYGPGSRDADLRGFEWYYLWRLAHREQMSLLHSGGVEEAGFTLDHQRLITRSKLANNQRVIKVWDLTTGQELVSFQERISLNSRDNSRTAMSGDRVVTIEGGGHEAQVRDLYSKRLIRSIAELTTVIRVAWLGPPKMGFLTGNLLTGNEDGTVKVHDLTTGQILARLQLPRGPVTSVIYFGAETLAIVSQEKTATVWNFMADKVTATFQEPDPIERFEVLPTGRQVLIGSKQRVKVCELATGKVLVTFEGRNNLPKVVFDAEGQQFITWNDVQRDRAVELWSAETWRKQGRLEGHTDMIYQTDFSYDGKMIATASSDRTAKLWEVATQREIITLRGHTAEVRQVQFSSDDRKVVTSSDDRTAKIWDLADLMEPVFDGHRDQICSAAFAPDTRHFATGSRDHTVKVWDVSKGLLFTLAGHTDIVFSVAFSPDGKLIASGSADGTARLWQAATGEEIKGKTFSHGAPDFDGWIRSVAFSPDGRMLATAGNDKTIRLWEVSTGRLVRKLVGHTDLVISIAFSPDGRTLASGSWDQTVRLWDLATGHDRTLKGHTEHVWAVAFSPDGKRVASGGADKVVRLWDVASGREIMQYEGHSYDIFAIAFSPDGQRLATGSKDKTVRLWNAATGEELLTLKDHTDQVWAVAFAPDGQTLVSGGDDRVARVWRAATENEVVAKSKLQGAR